MSESKSTDLSRLRIDRSRSETSNSTIRRRGRMILWGLLGAAVLLVLFFLFRAGFSTTVEVEAYNVIAVSPAQQNAVLTASGYVVAQRQAAVASKGTGRLVYLGVEEGDQVKEGQIIAQLEHSDLDAALAEAKASLNQALANLEQARAERADAEANFIRHQKLLADQLIARSAYDAAEARFKRAQAAVGAGEAAVQVARTRVRAAEIALEYTNIRAPFDGTVLTKNADVGEIVAPFGAATTARAAVVSIADMASLEVEADVSESNIQRIQPGQSCEIVLDAYPDTRYPGVVSKIVPTADRAKATVLTKIKFVERDQRVLPEMSAKVTFLAQPPATASINNERKILIPSSALTTRNGEQVVFVIRDGSVIATPVAVAGTSGSQLEVRSGLSEGQQIVRTPPANLQDGMRVKVVVK
ncbi:MAG: efflux RND transporter periplasmic adaptor subunit [candidate division KSB1 bacterium]|nr:efflux RND transporter periplasmic adaptor subunit [candidate division KSB1 bacterium]MDZ7272800.1 efflux RND transporter periplasmic adaptor subunit [candidate division KSB1 bacterium]MDZ7284176.1 efflux RND transporter periplasmic adaptor subunit [candidate division KSB1 bacterium]MDZ7297426.1 efflux RND transporter periplasmic adaptor subunit [candidate division KSB1 bacterium]MDZ7308174.1 efflux RND transporter periplasmic adaptor subunit [candidate division KSB1 bacterium]